MEQTRPSAIVKAVDEQATITSASVAELLTVCIGRLTDRRKQVLAATDQPRAGEIAREYALAITHAEDAITRANKGNYRAAGIFAITDAERTGTDTS